MLDKLKSIAKEIRADWAKDKIKPGVVEGTKSQSPKEPNKIEHKGLKDSFFEKNNQKASR